MNFVSWNVNGLRALHKKSNWKWFLKVKPDFFCIQETKAHPEQLPEKVREPEGYFSCFSSSQDKKGYSGVALYSKVKPKKVEYGMGIKRFDNEGRIIVAYFDDFVLLNVYFPNGGMSSERLKYKLDFYDAFLTFMNTLKRSEKKIILCGDVNTAHEEVDLARPKENSDNTGFLREEREWIDEVISSGYIDTFRYMHPNTKDKYSYWDLKTRARDRNVGWRIDYFFVSGALENKIKKAEIHDDVLGSDHCPIELVLSI